MADKKKKTKTPEISNVEWGMVISILGIIDIIQVVLDLMAGLGALLNRFVSFATGLAWSTYLYLRGIYFDTPKILSIIIAMFLEEVPALDAMPFWFLDGAVMMASVKAEKQLEKMAGVAVAAAAIAAAPETGGASLAAGEAAEGALVAEEGAAVAGAEEDSLAEKVAEGSSENSDGDDDNQSEDEDENSDENPEPEDDEEGKSDNENKKSPDRDSQQNKQPSQSRSSFLNRSSSGSSSSSEEGDGNNDNTLDLRGGTAARQRAEKDRRLGALQNITDLSLSYGERKKAKEDEENSLTE